METIVLKSVTADGKNLEATFLPEFGMNMISYKCGDVEVIDQSTKNLFDERFAGLGALIGPHFHHRKHPAKVQDESLFPHIAKIKEKGIQEPFSHGIARYAPWKADKTENSVKAVLTGKDVWNGVALATLEGQNFKMTYEATLNADGLKIILSVVSDTDSLVGLHYYYTLPDGEGTVTSQVQKKYRDNEGVKELSHHKIDVNHNLTIDLKDIEIDNTYYPHPDPLLGTVVLDTKAYQLVTKYSCLSQENGWQIYHPKGASFVCIEPISAQDPRHPNLTVSSLNIHLQIFPKQ